MNKKHFYTFVLNKEFLVNFIIKIRYFLNKKNFFFIQIGAHDGKTLDPINKYILKYRWKGILVEPVDYLFERLKMNYSGFDELIFENVAIYEKEGFNQFYKIKNTKSKQNILWLDMISSFKKNVILRHKKFIPKLQSYLSKTKVRCIRFHSLIEKYHVSQIDLLVIDTEGYDFSIIKSINFLKIRPFMILYEHKHLTKKCKEESFIFLKKRGYFLIHMEYDTFAFRFF